MAIVTSTALTERMTRRLQRAGRQEWIAESNGDAWGKFLIFQVGGRCIAGCGWTQREAEELIAQRIEDAAYDQACAADYQPTGQGRTADD